MGKPKFDLVELWLQIPVIWGTNEKPPPTTARKPKLYCWILAAVDLENYAIVL